MVDDGGSLRLMGFGRPPPQVEQQSRRTVLGNTSGLALPRLPTISPPGKSSDIYSFGRVCIEVGDHVALHWMTSEHALGIAVQQRFRRSVQNSGHSPVTGRRSHVRSTLVTCQ